MRRLLIIVSLVITVLLASGVATWSYLQYQLKQLPVSGLDYQFSSLSMNHVGLSDLSFIYHDQNFQVPVQLQQMHISWQWQHWRPQLEIVVIEKLSLSLNQFPKFTTTTEQSPVQLPDNWKLPEWFPQSLQVLDVQLQLPCANQVCNYYAELRANNQKQLNAELRLNPGREHNAEQQLLIDLEYAVQHQQPSLKLSLATTQQFDWRLHTDIQNGRFQLQTQQPADWLLQELAKWNLAFPPALYGWLHAIHNDANISGSWQSNVTDKFDLQRWQQDLNATLRVQAIIPEQLELAVDTSLQSKDWSGSLYAQILPQSTSLLHDLPTLSQSMLTATEATSLSSQWYFELDRQAQIEDWYQQLSGAVQLEFNSPSPVIIPSVGRLQGEANAEIQLHHHHITRYQLDASGMLLDPEFNQFVQPYGLQPGDIEWRIQANDDLSPALNALPLQINLQSQGDTSVQFTSEVLLNLEAPAIEAREAQVQLAQRVYEWRDTSLQDIKATVSFNLDWKPGKLTLNSSQPFQLGFGLQHPEISADLMQLSMTHWQIQGDPQHLSTLSLKTDMDINLKSLQQSMLYTQDWDWQGQLQGGLEDLDVTGELHNQSGLRLFHDAKLASRQLLVNWQMRDTFLLAGNPLAETLSNWPELLTLQRGRANANGQLKVPLLNNEEPGNKTLSNEWQAQTTLNVNDLAGIYDTSEFSGLTTQLHAILEHGHFALSLPRFHIQNLRQGLDFGPFELVASYSAPLSSLLSGQLDIEQNQLTLFNGSLSLENRIYNLDAEVLEAELSIHQLDLNQLLLQYPASDISGNGLLSGTIPLQWDSEGISVDRGRLGALPPGGQLQFRSPQASEMAASNPGVKIAVDALDDFHYSILDSGVTYQTDGTLLLALRLHGHNPNWQQGHPINLNITVEENLPDLITSLQLSNQVSTIIQERVQQRVLQSRNR